MRYGLARWISENSHWENVGSADSVQSALEQLRSLFFKGALPSIIITDLNLGNDKDDYTGLEFISQVCSLYPAVRIICYTMYKSPGIISDSIRRGAKGFVCKNAGETDLLLCMEKVLSGETYIEEDLKSSVKTYDNALLSLTGRERQIFDMILMRKSNEEMAKELGVQKRAVESYCSRIYNKLDCNDRDKIIEVYS